MTAGKSDALRSARGGAGEHSHACRATGVCIDCLAESTLAKELTESQIQTLSTIIEPRILSKGEVLITEGEHDDRLYSIVRGDIEVSLERGHNQEVLAKIGPGNLIGELAFLDGLKRTATVSAISDQCCIYALHRSKLESLLESEPLLVYNVMRAIVRSAHRTVGTMDAVYADLMQYISGAR